MNYTAAVITVSDRCSRGERVDTSGPAIKAMLEADGWEVGAYGIRTPVLRRSALLRPDQLDLVLVPCTAFDAACRRVGMGKGYYDRYLPRCTRAVKVGVAFEAQRVEAAAVDAHDQRLDGFVTEGGLYFGTDTTEL